MLSGMTQVTVALVKPSARDVSKDSSSAEQHTLGASSETAGRSGRHWKSASSWLEYFLGSLHYRKRITMARSTVNNSNKNLAGRRKEEVLVTYRTPAWLINKAWEARSLKASSGWTIHLRVYNILPRHSEVFDYARQGKVKELQTLFERWEVSPFIRDDSLGGTLLHVSLAKFL